MPRNGYFSIIDLIIEVTLDFIHLDLVSAFSVLLPIILVVIGWRVLNRELKLIATLLMFSALSDALSYIFISYSINSWPIVNVFFLIQFVILYFVFFSNFKKLVNILFYLFILFCLINYFFGQSPFKFNSISSYSGALFMLVLALSYLYRLFWQLPVERVQDLPMLWIAFAVLIYFGGTLFLFLFNNYLIDNEPGTHQAIWVLHNMLNVSKNVFLSIALWKHYKQSTSPG